MPHIVDAFRTGRGFGWHEHHDGLFTGTELFFRPGYAASLISSWIPASHRERSSQRDEHDDLKGGARQERGRR